MDMLAQDLTTYSGGQIKLCRRNSRRADPKPVSVDLRRPQLANSLRMGVTPQFSPAKLNPSGASMDSVWSFSPSTDHFAEFVPIQTSIRHTMLTAMTKSSRLIDQPNDQFPFNAATYNRMTDEFEEI